MFEISCKLNPVTHRCHFCPPSRPSDLISKLCSDLTNSNFMHCMHRISEPPPCNSTQCFQCLQSSLLTRRCTAVICSRVHISRKWGTPLASSTVYTATPRRDEASSRSWRICRSVRRSMTMATT